MNEVTLADLLAGRSVETVPRLALTLDEAAVALGLGADSFRRYVRPYVRVIRQGRHLTVPVRELERYVDEHAAKVLE